MKGTMTEPWLTVRRGEAPLLVSIPHTGLELPSDATSGLVSAERARHDADWHIDRLYAFAHDLGATIGTPRSRARSST